MSSEWIYSRHWMLTILMCGLSLVSASVANANQPTGGDDVAQPYVVYVAHEAVYARCGPDGDYYRTDPLRLGQQLEVYLETDDGWLGIRPPEYSFSWVPAEDIELSGDEQFGRVSGSKAVAWIGTHLGRARKYRWQVQLPRGEEVAVIGKAERQKDDGTETWYRIVPPSGEFRWVHRTQIAESPEQLVQMHRRRRGEPTGEPTLATPLTNTTQRESDQRDGERAGTERYADASAEPSILSTEKENERDDELSQAEDGLRATDPLVELQAIDRNPVGSGLAMVVGDDIRVREIRKASTSEQTLGENVRPPASAQQADDESWVTGSRPSQDYPIATVDHTGPLMQDGARPGASLQPTIPPVLKVVHHETPEELEAVARRVKDADTGELQLELSHQLAVGASARMVEPIRTKARELIATLDEGVQRGHARLVLERVEQYQRIARRRDGEAEPDGQNESIEPVPDANVQNTGAAATASGDFVRTGYLVQVYSARPQAPPYALNDASGRTLAYVSPALGVRLRSYLNRHVGLKGEMTFDTGLNTPHVIARQAVPVQR